MTTTKRSYAGLAAAALLAWCLALALPAAAAPPLDGNNGGPPAPPAPAPAPLSGGIIQHITFGNVGRRPGNRAGDGRAVFPAAQGTSVTLTLDKNALRSRLTPPPPPGESLVKRFQLLTVLTEQLVTLQAAFVEFQRLYVANNGNPNAPAVQQASTALGSVGTAVLGRLVELEQSAAATDPEVQQALITAARKYVPSNDALAQAEISAGRPLSAAVLQTGRDAQLLKPYQTLIDVLGAAAQQIERSLTPQLRRRVESGQSRVQITLTAALLPHRGRGAATALPLPGYYESPEGTPVPVPQFATVVDARTEAELAAAREWIAVARDFNTPNGLGTQARAAYAQARAELNTLAQTLRQAGTDQFDQVLVQLNQAVQNPPAGTQAARLIELRGQIQRLRNLTALVPVLPQDPAQGQDDVRQLLAIAASFRDATSGLATLTGQQGGLPALLTEATGVLNTVLGNNAPSLKNSILKAINDTRTALNAQQGAITALRTSLAATADKLGLTGDLGQRAQILDQYLRRLSLNDLVDTRISLQPTTLADIQPGDEIRIAIRAERPAGTDDERARVIASDEQRLRVERYGIYSEWRGALLFVDQRSNRSRQTNFQPVPALGYQFRFGSERHRGLFPSPGLSLALLDFSDQSDLEIGLAGNVTLLDDMFWAGYGYNLQAKAQYFYVGVNVLQVINILRGRR